MKTHIFIDFWNFQLGINSVAPQNYRADWKKISPWLVAQASAAVGRPLSFEGTHVYMSYSPNSKKDASLKDFATNVLSRFSGVQVSMVERKAQAAPICPACHQSIPNCPHCGSPITRMVEKGVDTAIVTDMVKFAWEGSLEVAILVSSDRDFIPAVQMLTAKGYKVINAHFPPTGMNLAGACWASIDLKKGLTDLSR
ncbi:MAG: NYN domain-containing protein [Anaerolineales bacterium]|nr:MAG: NYN domain-containing protein [Anaerolineales bacterium]